MIDAKSEDEGGPAMSKFEVVTAMAFAAFADAPVDIAVIEVGMGGRWDATNVVDAAVAVITPDRRRPRRVPRRDDRRDRRREGGHHRRAPRRAGPGRHCRRDRAPAARGDGGAAGPGGGADAAGGAADSEFAVLSWQVGRRRPTAGAAGASAACTRRVPAAARRVPAQNAALALAAVEAFGAGPSASSTSTRCVRRRRQPGRLERMRSAPTVFIDAAHNPAGAAALADALTTEFDFHFLVGCSG